MKTFKRLMSFALALLMLASVIPSSVISARAVPSEEKMMNNDVLAAMEYLGFDMEGIYQPPVLISPAAHRMFHTSEFEVVLWNIRQIV